LKRPDGVTVVAIYEFLSAIPGLIGACAILVFAFPGALQGAQGMDVVGAIFGLTIAFLFVGAGSIAAVIAGWGLLQLKEWARWLTIALAILTLFAFPIGTIIGGLIIWYLLQDEVRKAFQRSE
jgi:hypothetical protein